MATAGAKRRAEPDQQIMGGVPFNKLHFDPLNPRREPMQDEAEIRQVLCEDEGVLQLATHIAAHGLNPLARIAVIDHPKLPGQYIVPEGNRRLCALQLLRDPQRAPTAAARKTFERLSKGGWTVPDRIEAVWFKTRTLADPWLSVNHEGEQGGIGTVAWGAAEKARFNRSGSHTTTRPKNPNAQALRLVEYAVGRGLITPEQQSLISLTTLTRYLPSVRSALALLNSEDCSTNADPGQFDAALRRFLHDAVPSGDTKQPAPVHSRSRANDWKTYAETLRQEGVSPADRTRAPYDPAQAPAGAPASTAPRRRSVTDPGKRKNLILSNFIVPFTHPVLQRMVIEGKQHTDCKDNQFAANYLIRAILEQCVYLYARGNGVGVDGMDLDRAILAVVEHAKKRTPAISKGLAGVLTTTAGDKRAKHGLQALGNGVHGGKVPSPSDNKSNWETLQPALQYLLDHAKKK